MSNEKTQVRGAAADWLLRSCDGDATEVPLADGFTVGRSDECDLVLSEGFVSRKHASFSVQGMKLLVTDHGSSNGTYVNGEKVEQRALKPGDRIRFDEYEFEVALNAPAPAESGATMVRPAAASDARAAPTAPVTPQEGGSDAPGSGRAVAAPDLELEAEAASAAEPPVAPEPAPTSVSPSESEPVSAAPEADVTIVAGSAAAADADKTVVVDAAALKAAATAAAQENSDKTAVWQASDVAEGGTVIVGNGAPPRARAAASGEVLLTGLTDPVQGREYGLSKDKVTVGRSPLNDIILRSGSVSSQHAEFVRENGEWVLCDLNSSNGTCVNDERIGDCALSAGDIIAFGDVQLEFDAAGKQRTPISTGSKRGGGKRSGMAAVLLAGLAVVALALGAGMYFLQQRGGSAPAAEQRPAPVTAAGLSLAEIWRTAVGQKNSVLVGPVVADLNGDGVAEVIVLESAGRLLYHDSRSGAQTVAVQLPGEVVAAPLLVPINDAAGVLVAGVEGTVTLYNARAQAVWQTELGRGTKGVYASPVLVQAQGARFAVIPSQGLGPVAIDLSSGRKLWDGTGLGAGDLVTSLVMEQQGGRAVLFGGDDRGYVNAWVATSLGAESLWRTPLGAQRQALTLVAAQGKLVVATAEGELLALNTANGEMLWRVQLNGAMLGRPAVLDDRLLVPLQGGEVAIVGIADGNQFGRVPVGGALEADVTLVGRSAVVVTGNGSVVIVDKTGKLQARQFIPGVDAFVRAPYAGDVDGDGFDELFLLGLNGVLSRYVITR